MKRRLPKKKKLEKLWRNPRKQNYDFGASGLVKISGALEDVEKRDANVPLVYFSSCYGSFPPCRRVCGSIVNTWMESYKFKKGHHYGWCLSNTVGDFSPLYDVAKRIYTTNYFCNVPKLTDENSFFWGVSDGTLYLIGKETDKSPNGFYKYTKCRAAKMLWNEYRNSIKSVIVLNTLKPKYTDHWFALSI